MSSEINTIITCDKSFGMEMIKIIEVEPRCHFCNEDITEDNFGAIFSKPTRVCCNSICCLIEAIPFEENKYE